MEQADVDEGGSDQAIPLAMENENGVGGPKVNEIARRWFAWRDAAQDHPEIDGAVNAKKKVSSGGNEDVPAALAGVGAGHLSLVVRDGMGRGRATVFGWEEFAFRSMGGWRHALSFYAIAA
jgi:hypothetical protein